jgi:lysophospholipase L1-like esterase
LYCHISKTDQISIVKLEELLEKAWFKPHPHLVYVFKPNIEFVMNAFDRPTITINSFGFRSTLEYDVTTEAKPESTLRIATLGGSTTMCVNDDNEIWPYLIGKNLSIHYPNKKIEILNEGIMGYTSLDNLIDLAIRVIDYDSDIYVIYLGTNDYLAVSPLDIYRADNSHFRKTLWENLSFSFVELVPRQLLKSKVVKAFLKMLGAKDRRDLLKNTGTDKFRKRFYVAVEDKQKVNDRIRDNTIRNIESMVGIIKSHDPDALVLLSTFYDSDNPKYIADLNIAIRQFANKSNVVFVDAAGRIPHIQEMTFDYVHFTKDGDEHMAEIFSEAIIDVFEP